MRVGDCALGDEVANGAESVEALGYGPGETFAFGFVLDVARCHVDCEEVVCTTTTKNTQLSDPHKVKPGGGRVLVNGKGDELEIESMAPW